MVAAGGDGGDSALRRTLLNLGSKSRGGCSRAGMQSARDSTSASCCFATRLVGRAADRMVLFEQIS